MKKFTADEIVDYYDNEYYIHFLFEKIERELLKDKVYCKQQRFSQDYLRQAASIVYDYEYNPEFMEDYLCIIGSTLSLESNIPKKIIYKMIKHIHEIIILGEPTIAEVYRASNYPFIFKTSVNKSDTIVHEAFVGLYVTNNFRKFVPNFAYVLGYFECSPPILDENANVVSWCTKKSKTPYVIYENVKGKTLKDELQNLSRRRFLVA